MQIYAGSVSRDHVHWEQRVEVEPMKYGRSISQPAVARSRRRFHGRVAGAIGYRLIAPDLAVTEATTFRR